MRGSWAGLLGGDACCSVAGENCTAIGDTKPSMDDVDDPADGDRIVTITVGVDDGNGNPASLSVDSSAPGMAGEGGRELSPTILDSDGASRDSDAVSRVAPVTLSRVISAPDGCRGAINSIP